MTTLPGLREIRGGRPDLRVPHRRRSGDTSVGLEDTTNVRLRDLLAAMARELVDGLDAEASAVSRAIGDVLVLVAECAPEGKTLLLGQGYLIPDFPLTQEVLLSGRPRALTLSDEGVDPAEARVLEELGFASLLMLPLPMGEAMWGLVEVYRNESRPFGEDDTRVAGEIVARMSARSGL